MDNLTPDQRSWNMSRVRSKDTLPELRVRRLVHALGYRYRLHSRKLIGHPDLVFGPRMKVIFVHGCFWHRHKDCVLCRMPKSKLKFWRLKLEANRKRDLSNQEKLIAMGWEFLIIWECETHKTAEIASRIRTFLGER
jgi:DNA mismatch endonuclease, patch repair protein